MKIDKNTKILELLEKNPRLLDVLVNMSPEFNKLKNPVLRNTIGRFATLEHACQMSGIPYEEMSRKIAEAMAHSAEGALPASSAEERASRVETLKEIIRGLHEGKDVQGQKERFAELLGQVSGAEIAQMEQALMAEGMDAGEIQKLCDVHVQVLAGSFEGKEKAPVPPGHPVHTFLLENQALSEIVDRMRPILADLASPPDDATLKSWMAELSSLVASLAEVEKHYLRKENQLFPALEDHGVTGPSKVMWAIHNDIRKVLKTFQGSLDKGDPGAASAEGMVLITAISDMIYKEENILFPMALETLTDGQWERVLRGGEEIGYALVRPAMDWKAAEGPLAEAPPHRRADSSAPLWLSEGGLSPKQVDLILRSLPLDLTFVDSDDRVQYYSAGAERIFPRSPGIIGRSVQNCHPPKSIHVVQKILDSFRSGEQDSADFWIRMEDRFIIIRYFAIRDGQGNYEGCLEVSQDVTGIRALEGEKRLLDW